ncbi:MAG: LPXTG cell wall anchor domain-containing protein [Actinomycetota bacterium]
MTLRRLTAACAVSAIVVITSGGVASAVPGPVKVSSLRARSVVRVHGAVAQAVEPPPPPRHYPAPTKDNLPHTGPPISPAVGAGVGSTLIVLGAAGLGLLRRSRRAGGA